MKLSAMYKFVTWRSTLLFFGFIVFHLFFFQMLLLVYQKYAISNDGILIPQTQLEFKLFLTDNVVTDFVQVGNISKPAVISSLVMPSRHFCGIPVPIGKEGYSIIPKRFKRVGAIVLLKSGVSPFCLNACNASSTSSKNSLNFDVYMSVLCAQTLLTKLKDEGISRFIVLLKIAITYKMEQKNTKPLKNQELCSSRWAGGDMAPHALLRAYAVGSRLAKAFPPSNENATAAEELYVNIYNSDESKLEGLAILTAILSTWAGNDETLFLAYSNKLKDSPSVTSLFSNNIKAATGREFSRDFKWLNQINHPRFCISEKEFRCACSRLALVYSLSERYRSIVMASLQKEVLRAHALLQETLPAFLMNKQLSYTGHPDWTHWVFSLATGALCNGSWPLLTTEAFVNKGITICSSSSIPKSGCVSEVLIERLWRIKTFVAEQLQNSEAHREYAKLSSYPFLRTVANIVKQERNRSSISTNPWLQIFSGQSDSITLLLQALDLPYSELLNVAGRFVIEVYQSSTSNLFLRFLVNGEEVHDKLVFCTKELSSSFCLGEPFLAYLESSDAKSGFWNLTSTKLNQSSLNHPLLYNNICSEHSINNLVRSLGSIKST